MKVIPLFALLFILLFLSVPVSAATINPSVESQPWYCRASVTKWICNIGGTGAQGPPGLSGTGNNSYYYNSTSNETTIYNNVTFFENTTIGNNLTTISNYTYFTLVNITYSEMNQTPGPQGEKGDDGYTPVFGVDYFNGSEGINGTPGYTPVFGVDYFNGSDGADGAPGEKGDKGDQGDTGPAGPAGADGAANMTAGPQGPQGEKGDKGDTGDTGPMNMTANMTAGPAGADGATGATGPAGLDANVSTMYPVSSVYGTTNASANPATLLGVGTWASIQNITATYVWDSVSPTMTSDTLPSGNYTKASSSYSATYYPFKASDGTSGFWASAVSGAPWWWSIQVPVAKTVSNYTIYPRTDLPNNNPNTWKLNASNDGSTWTTLDTQTGISWSGTQKSFLFTNSNPYTYYCMSISSNNGGDGVAMQQITFYNATSSTRPVYYWERTA